MSQARALASRLQGEVRRRLLRSRGRAPFCRATSQTARESAHCFLAVEDLQHAIQGGGAEVAQVEDAAVVGEGGVGLALLVREAVPAGRSAATSWGGPRRGERDKAARLLQPGLLAGAGLPQEQFGRGAPPAQPLFALEPCGGRRAAAPPHRRSFWASSDSTSQSRTWASSACGRAVRRRGVPRRRWFPAAGGPRRGGARAARARRRGATRRGPRGGPVRNLPSRRIPSRSMRGPSQSGRSFNASSPRDEGGLGPGRVALLRRRSPRAPGRGPGSSGWASQARFERRDRAIRLAARQVRVRPDEGDGHGLRGSVAARVDGLLDLAPLLPCRRQAAILFDEDAGQQCPRGGRGDFGAVSSRSRGRASRNRLACTRRSARTSRGFAAGDRRTAALQRLHLLDPAAQRRVAPGRFEVGAPASSSSVSRAIQRGEVGVDRVEPAALGLGHPPAQEGGPAGGGLRESGLEVAALGGLAGLDEQVAQREHQIEPRRQRASARRRASRATASLAAFPRGGRQPDVECDAIGGQRDRRGSTVRRRRRNSAASRLDLGLGLDDIDIVGGELRGGIEIPGGVVVPRLAQGVSASGQVGGCQGGVGRDVAVEGGLGLARRTQPVPVDLGQHLGRPRPRRGQFDRPPQRLGGGRGLVAARSQCARGRADRHPPAPPAAAARGTSPPGRLRPAPGTIRRPGGGPRAGRGCPR